MREFYRSDRTKVRAKQVGGTRPLPMRAPVTRFPSTTQDSCDKRHFQKPQMGIAVYVTNPVSLIFLRGIMRPESRITSRRDVSRIISDDHLKRSRLASRCTTCEA